MFLTALCLPQYIMVLHKIHKIVLHKVVYFVNFRGCDGEWEWVPEGVKVVTDCCEIGVFCG